MMIFGTQPQWSGQWDAILQQQEAGINEPTVFVTEIKRTNSMGIGLVRLPLYAVAKDQEPLTVSNGKTEYKTPPAFIFQEQDGVMYPTFFQSLDNAKGYADHYSKEHGPLMVIPLMRRDIDEIMEEARQRQVKHYILDFGWPEQMTGRIDDLLRSLQPPENN
jgi:hypothetical protein